MGVIAAITKGEILRLVIKLLGKVSRELTFAQCPLHVKYFIYKITENGHCYSTFYKQDQGSPGSQFAQDYMFINW